MKLSLAWIFDHIAADWRSFDIHDIVKRFNKTTAEIEAFYPVSIDASSVALGTIKSHDSQMMEVFCPEWKTHVRLAARNDVQEGDIVLIYRHADTYQWATMVHLGGHKSLMLPALSCAPEVLDGSWKKHIDQDDWIIEIDNKSINHRPDLWSHEGVAREIAAMYDLKFIHADAQMQEYKDAYAPSATSNADSITISVDNQGACKRYAALICDVTNGPSILSVLLRLVRIDSKPIDAVVDLTNYVMFDIGQPMHAFDVTQIEGNRITVRYAHAGETVQLLDGQKILLQPQSLVIADAKKPIALAGVMGGQEAKVTSATKRILLESATFDPATVRKTAAAAKIRTDASARFEKSLDPENSCRALKKFLECAKQSGLMIKYDPQTPITVIGRPQPQVYVSCTIEQIHSLLGVEVPVPFIEKTLHALGFAIERNNNLLRITVPSYRATKDIAIAQDIIEEIGRFYGYESIPTLLPRRYMSPFGMSGLLRVRHMKHLLAYGMGMQEVYNYALFDQEFINSIPYQPTQTLEVMSPVSENWRLLVTSLVPGLFKNVVDNAALHDELSFFEWARTWNLTAGNVHEYKKLSGIIYRKHEKVDFYQAKSDLETVFASLGLQVSWKQCDFSPEPWFMPFQTAYLYYGQKQIGIAGKMQKQCLHKHILGDAFIFELDGNFLLEYTAQQSHFVPLSKYQPTRRDVSMFVPLSTTVDQLISAVRAADMHIVQVALKDIFQKAEWGNRKSITIEYVMSDPHATLSKESCEVIALKVERELKQLGADIR